VKFFDKGTPRQGVNWHGNILTPHQGRMVIQVNREEGLASRTIVLSPRQVRLLRLARSRAAKLLGLLILLVTGVTIWQAARVPGLEREVVRMEGGTARLDSLERALNSLQRRYTQMQTMLGARPRPGAPSASTPPSTPPSASVLVTPVTPVAPR